MPPRKKTDDETAKPATAQANKTAKAAKPDPETATGADLAKAKDETAKAVAAEKAARQELQEAKAKADQIAKDAEAAIEKAANLQIAVEQANAKIQDLEAAAATAPAHTAPAKASPDQAREIPVQCHVRLRGTMFAPNSRPAMTRSEFNELKAAKAVEGSFDDYED